MEASLPYHWVLEACLGLPFLAVEAFPCQAVEASFLAGVALPCWAVEAFLSSCLAEEAFPSLDQAFLAEVALPY